MRTLDDAPLVNVFDDEFRVDGRAMIDELRATTWIVRTPIGAMVIDRAHVHHLLSDARLRPSIIELVRLQGVTDGPMFDMVASSVLALEGVDHARIRRLVSRSFTPRATDPHRPLMRDLIGELVDGFASRGSCEFMREFADQYPVQVICHLLGVPPEDHEKFARWGDALTHILSLELWSHLDEVQQASAGLRGYIDDLIVQRIAAPREDLVSDLIAASESDDRLSPVELRSLIGSLLFAGYDTTRNQLALGLTLFCEHPDQWKLLATRPEVAANAVEEIMRVAGTISATIRIATVDIDLDGWRIPQGTMVTLSMAAANHDPAAFADPTVFDITATRDVAQLTFGAGPHYCLGANLARAEMQEALPILARRMPDLAFDGEPEWRGMGGIYGPTHLPLCFTPVG